MRMTQQNKMSVIIKTKNMKWKQFEIVRFIQKNQN